MRKFFENIYKKSTATNSTSTSSYAAQLAKDTPIGGSAEEHEKQVLKNRRDNLGGTLAEAEETQKKKPY